MNEGCSWKVKIELTHVVDQIGSVLGRFEERRVGGVFEVASVLFKGSFVESLFVKKNKTEKQCFPFKWRSWGQKLYEVVQCCTYLTWVVFYYHEKCHVKEIGSDLIPYSPHCTASCSSQPGPAQVCPTQSSRCPSANPGPLCTWPK